PFIKYMSEKLKTGNLRSIHLNALPGRYISRLDITKLNIITELSKTKKKELSIPDSFIFEHLLKKDHFKFLINYKKISLEKLTSEESKALNFITRRLNGLFNQDEDNYLEHGVKTFSFGYPLLIKKSKSDPKRVIKAPIFIWSLDIHRSKSNKNEWTIVKTPDAPIYINEVLIAHINQDEGIQIDDLHPEYLADNKIDQGELVEIITKILNNLEVPDIDLQPNIEPFGNTTEIGKLAKENPYILWSGVFGLFKTQKQSIIQDITKLAETYDDTPFVPTIFKHSKNTSVHTDPSQQAIIHSISQTECKVIQGPPGTGKSQSITAIITNALENHKKILVVCEKKTALEVIENNLKNIDLGDLCTTIDDVSRDRKKIINHVRHLEQNGLNISNRFREMNYDSDLSQAEKLMESFNDRHNNLLHPVLNDQNAKDIIAEYLELSQKGFAVQHLFDNAPLLFTGDEYTKLNEAIRQGADWYEEVIEPHLIFDKYNGFPFLQNYSGSYERQFFKDLEALEKLAQKFVDHWENLTFKETAIAENFKIGNQRMTALKAIFFKSHKMVKQHWVDTRIIYNQIITFLKEKQLVALPPQWEETTENLAPIRQAIKEMQLLTVASSNRKTKFRTYYQWRSFFENQPAFVQAVLNILKTEIKSTDNWWTIFKLEYLNLFLEKKENEIGPFNENGRQLTKIIELQKRIKSKQKDKILSIWSNTQRQAIKDFNKEQNVKQLFNYRKNSKYSKRNSLRKIINDEFDLFTTFFPVILVNPIVCSSIMPLKKGLFDLVIFDEASQLRLEDTFTAFYRGKVKVISGDHQQMPPSNYFATDIQLEEDLKMEAETTEVTQSIDRNNPMFLAESASLLEFGNNLNAEITNISYLDFHYRSKHPYLIDFSNAAFYGKRLIPIPSATPYVPIRFLEVNGNYKQSSNLEEAQKVIDIIRNEILPYANGSYPTLGIATFNLTQRNVIKDLIYVNAAEDKAFRDKLDKIGLEDEWFVKNLENIQGDERDIIMISTTFGINANGKFIQNFGPLNNFEKGYKLLNVIITRAKKKLYLITSIPEIYYSTKYQSEIKTRGNKGKAVFYAYLDYCKSVENHDETKRQEILQLLTQNGDDSIHYQLESETLAPFEQQVFEHLSDYIKPEFIDFHYPFGGYQIDIVIKDELFQPQIAIECDGTDWHKTREAYVYDIHRQKIIESYGLKYLRIWSKNWWEDTDRAAIELVSLIMETMPFVVKEGVK
ncbi:MAG: AAA domain-containing protein, partial [Saprospiraceae bacterium]